MRKALAAVLLAVGLGSTGCVTMVTEDAIHRNIHDQGGRAIAEVATFPVTAAADVALLPAYVVATPFVISALSHGNWMAH